MSPTPSSFPLAFATELWIAVLVKGRRRNRKCLCSRLPTQAVSKLLEYWTSQHHVGDRACLCKAKLLGYSKLVMRGLPVLFSCSVGSYVWLESVRATFDWELPGMSGRKSVEQQTLKHPQTCHCLTLYRGLRSFKAWPTENSKAFVQHLLVASVMLSMMIVRE